MLVDNGSQDIAHIAGPELIFAGRWQRQRCSWCGATIIDLDLLNLIVPVGSGPPSSYAQGALVRVTENGNVYLGQFDLQNALPDNSCTMFDPSITA